MTMTAPTSEFTLLEPSDPRWNALFQRLPESQKDIFYRPEFAEVAARYLHKEGQPRCAVLEIGDSFVMYPFLQRSLQALLSDTGLTVPGYDLQGFYGRGGLVTNSQDLQVVEQFHQHFKEYSQKNKILCSFDRYHPVMQNEKFAPSDVQRIDIGGFIVVDLDKPIDTITKEFKHAVRKNIKKANRAGITVFEESNVNHLDAYLSIYKHTMDRNDATAFYYVDPKFYQTLAEKLPKNVHFFYAMLDGVAVSCELVLSEGLYYHSFLGGTLESAMDKCPNHLLKQEIIRYAKDHGGRYYLLGGGATPYNGVWAYKQCFAPNGDRSSFVGGTVYDQPAYDQLRQQLSQAGISFPTSRFQFYDRH